MEEVIRTLTEYEIKYVSGAGIVTDDPKVKGAIATINAIGFGVPSFGVKVGTKAVHGSALVMDAAFTSVQNNIMKLFG